ncbi:MAG: hypothetical protein O3A87_03010 [Verrucomicrobia bacterium]|nr:hypothetical protein [Verrucomicrobiota bacterium]MDA1005436.1 hypothetical protein [Verrucomicrobiota bacterium]
MLLVWRGLGGELDPEDGNSFACFSLPEPTFMQTLQGRKGYHLECRLTGGSPEQYIHLRASYGNSNALLSEITANLGEPP